ncbi:hypothetical protein SAMN05880574_1113 [Chryseobacterium sp. RU37D]|uniref:anti-sigma factor n=1 Tax=Chryseobacterium sp. RU37D TaxID=1907397 RepID=UPI000953A767|nr:anti-sigma factor [Chryseobacterium sp. RU37D]SIQ35797.1 hypothetical protein SAMN05880574_1113 [Chryseobacterium sp. RU37D]
MKKIVFSSLTITSLLLSSCNNDNDPPTTKNLTLSIHGLENLGSNYVYEGWLMVSGVPVSSGRFTVNSSGQLSQTLFPVPYEQLSTAKAFILTIEPSTNDDPAPSKVHILAGDFNGNTGTASIYHTAALGNNFSTTAGKYILATPTDGGAMTNEESGVWFLDNSSGSAVAGLSLPTLPEGWKYEGWAVINGIFVSTGTFTSPSIADDNANTSQYKESANNGPAFPGEDFLKNAPTGLTFPTDLKEKTIVISIEPYPDNSPLPFTLKPLLQTIPANAAVHTVLSMTQNFSSFPTGSFSR